MALPSKKAIKKGIADWLEAVDQRNEDATYDDLADHIVEQYLALLGSGVQDPPLVPHVGMAFRHPSLSGVWHVAHTMNSREVWIISATTNYGASIHEDSGFWRYAEPSTAKAGAPGNNKDGWKAGDKVSRRQRQFMYYIAAVGEKCALLINAQTGQYLPESNANLATYYRKEIKAEEMDW